MEVDAPDLLEDFSFMNADDDGRYWFLKQDGTMGRLGEQAVDEVGLSFSDAEELLFRRFTTKFTAIEEWYMRDVAPRGMTSVNRVLPVTLIVVKSSKDKVRKYVNYGKRLMGNLMEFRLGRDGGPVRADNWQQMTTFWNEFEWWTNVDFSTLGQDFFN